MKKLSNLIFLIFIISSCTTQKAVEEPDPSSMSDEELKSYAQQLAKDNIIVDGHVDLPYRMEVAGFMLRKTVEDVSVLTDGNFDYPKAKEGGLDAPFMSIYIPSSYLKTGGAKAFADSLIDMTLGVPKAYPDKFAPANTPQDIKNNFEKGLISLPLGMENGAPIEDDLANVEYFFNRGIRYITLTHSKDNQIADSSYDTTYTWNGISPFGEQVIAEMNRLGIMVDISQDNLLDRSKDQWFWPSPGKKIDQNNTISPINKTLLKPNNFSVLKININEVDLLKLEKPLHKRFIWKKIDNWRCIEVNP